MSLEKYIGENKEKLDRKVMPIASKDVFEKILKEELHSSKNNQKFIWRCAIAASLVIFIGMGVVLMNQRKKAALQTKRLLSDMVSESTSTRLQAVYDYEDEYKKEDDRLLKTLFDLLHEDASNNVKIAAIDALLKFPNNEKMRLELVKALENEKEPLVQLKLIDAVMKLKENRAEKPLQKLIEKEQTFPEVKGNASIAMNNIKK